MQMKNSAAQWFGRVVWIGITVNLLFVIPCFFFPETMRDLLGLTKPNSIIWVRTYGILLFVISIIYIPSALNPLRYHALTTMHTPGARMLLFLILILSKGQETGFLSITLVDLLFGVVAGILVFSSFVAELIQKEMLVPQPKQGCPRDYVKQG
jgi:hypothetical protein